MSKVTRKEAARQQTCAADGDVLRLVRDEVLVRMQLTMLNFVEHLFAEETGTLIGEKWSRKREGQAHSGGTERGSIYLEGRRVPLRYPRIADATGSHATTTYQALRSYDLMSEGVLAKTVRGISNRDFGATVGEIIAGTGLGKSTVSRAFKRASQKSLDQINSRDLSNEQLVAMMLDGIAFGETLVVAALGITAKGQKRLLGLVEGHTENSQVVGDLLQNLVDRNLALTDVFLAVIDGSKALRSALVKRWGDRVIIQRCQQHKKRNVIDHLPKRYHAEVRRRMKMAYGLKSYDEAHQALRTIVTWLGQISEAAATSLEEGMEETLTVVKLGLPDILRQTLATTNPIESIFDGVRTRSGRVKRWRTGKGRMVMRWAAATGLEVEKRLHRIRGHRLINILIDRLRSTRVDKEVMVG
jgi:transposase-like protein